MLFDYLVDAPARELIGFRVLVPFGRGQRIGIIVECPDAPSVPRHRLLHVKSVLDDSPAIGSELMETLKWTAKYCRQPLAEVLWSALPRPVHKGKSLMPKFALDFATITELGKAVDPGELRGAVRQSIMQELSNRPDGVRVAELEHCGKTFRAALSALRSKGWVELSPSQAPSMPDGPSGLTYILTDEQARSRDEIAKNLSRYGSYLLHGITGSGKTEVYLHVASQVVKNGGQVLLLVPEINLTPQLLERIRSSLSTPAYPYHSSMTVVQRHKTWWLASTGEAKLVVGTRSAAFLPFQKLGLIVMDEEHDSSFKQSEGVRYHARKVAVRRAMALRIPIVLGSATPSIETVRAAQANRLDTLRLTQRATRVEVPSVRTVDLNDCNTIEGIAVPLLSAMQDRLNAGEQSLIFINRRGFAPVVMCLDCKWFQACDNCEVKMVYHSYDKRLRCHLCGAVKNEMPQTCPSCDSSEVKLFGEGTQKVELTLQRRFPGSRVIRIDSDTTRGYAQMEETFTRIQQGNPDILVGTQMLSKGHNFPHVTLVGVLNVDHGFYSIDFRAREHMVQQVLQVAGRAGRIEKSGEVIIQTAHPANEVFDAIRSHDYMRFAEHEIVLRQEAHQPPFAHHALLRANSTDSSKPVEFLAVARRCAIEVLETGGFGGVRVLDAVPSPISKVASRFRAQLLVKGDSVQELQNFLAQWTPRLEKLKKPAKLRWNLDVDPLDFL